MSEYPDVNRPARRGLRSGFSLFAAAALAALLGCSAGSPPAATRSVTFLIVRHAEKSTDDPRDPSLSEAGRASAQRLAQVLASTPPTAIYATPYRRTRQTAQPSADAHHLTVVEYQAQLPAADLAKQLRDAHPGGVVLVVGHSNTVPDIVAALSGRPVPPMPEDEYGVLYRVVGGSPQDAVLERAHY